MAAPTVLLGPDLFAPQAKSWSPTVFHVPKVDQETQLPCTGGVAGNGLALRFIECSINLSEVCRDALCFFKYTSYLPA